MDGNREEIAAGFAISSMLHLSGYKEDWELVHTPLLLDPNTSKEAMLTN